MRFRPPIAAVITVWALSGCSHLPSACTPELVGTVFSKSGAAQSGVYVGTDAIGRLPNGVQRNVSVRRLLYLYKEPNFRPIIVVGIPTTSSNYAIRLAPGSGFVGEDLTWTQFKSGEDGFTVLGQPMWLGVFTPECKKYDFYTLGDGALFRLRFGQ